MKSTTTFLIALLLAPALAAAQQASPASPVQEDASRTGSPTDRAGSASTREGPKSPAPAAAPAPAPAAPDAQPADAEPQPPKPERRQDPAPAPPKGTPPPKPSSKVASKIAALDLAVNPQ